MTNTTFVEFNETGSESEGIMGSQMELYVVMGILSFLSIVGVAGNALVLYVFAQKRDRMTSTLFILALAFVDFTTCLVVIPYTIYMEYVNFYIKYDILCKIYQFLITSNIPFSALIMVAIAIDRYFCICHPFLHAMNLMRAKIMILGLGSFAAGLGIVTALMYGVVSVMDINILSQTMSRNASGSGESAIIRATPVPYSVDTYPGVEPQLADMVNHSLEYDQGGSPHLLPVNTGHCAPNTLYLGSSFQWYYQKFYTAMFLVSLMIVVVLYVLIYKSVLSRRTKRQKQKSKSLPLTVSTAPDNEIQGQEETLLTTVNGEANELVKNGASSSPAAAAAAIKVSGASTTVQLSNAGSNTSTTTTTITPAVGKKEKREKDRRKSTKKDRTRVANLKTAAMLFVVTVVFIVTFLPAFLMALQLLPYDIIIFYMYFANNVANPVIYSFMNKNFRDDLKKLFCVR